MDILDQKGIQHAYGMILNIQTYYLIYQENANIFVSCLILFKKFYFIVINKI